MKKANSSKHHLCYTSEYLSWINMKSRCLYKKGRAYKNYGGRGITVCDEWLHSFEQFYKDMGIKPSSKHSLDRIDNNGNYNKSNCRWANWAQQCSNRRNNNILELNGVFKPISQWCKDLGGSASLVPHRLKHNWPIEIALTKLSLCCKK